MVQDHFKLSKTNTQRILTDLVDAGRIIRSGTGRNTAYSFAPIGPKKLAETLYRKVKSRIKCLLNPEETFAGPRPPDLNFKVFSI